MSPDAQKCLDALKSYRDHQVSKGLPSSGLYASDIEWRSNIEGTRAEIMRKTWDALQELVALRLIKRVPGMMTVFLVE